MKVFLDTEFIDDGRTIELLSLGAVREDGFSFYMVNAEADHAKASPWVVEHVLPNLLAQGPLLHQPTRATPQVIATMFQIFAERRDMPRTVPDRAPEFWGYFADYDWVAVCQLYGRMLDLPKGWPHFCLDVQQELVRQKLTVPLIQARWRQTSLDYARQGLPEHHALGDAWWTKALYEALQA